MMGGGSFVFEVLYSVGQSTLTRIDCGVAELMDCYVLPDEIYGSG